MGRYCLKGRVEGKNRRAVHIICSYCLPLLALHVTNRIVYAQPGGRHGERPAAFGSGTHCRWLDAANACTCLSRCCWYLAGPFVLYVNMRSWTNVSKSSFFSGPEKQQSKEMHYLLWGHRMQGRRLFVFRSVTS